MPAWSCLIASACPMGGSQLDSRGNPSHHESASAQVGITHVFDQPQDRHPNVAKHRDAAPRIDQRQILGRGYDHSTRQRRLLGHRQLRVSVPGGISTTSTSSSPHSTSRSICVIADATIGLHQTIALPVSATNPIDITLQPYALNIRSVLPVTISGCPNLPLPSTASPRARSRPQGSSKFHGASPSRNSLLQKLIPITAIMAAKNGNMVVAPSLIHSAAGGL